MSIKTAAQHNAEVCGQVEVNPSPSPRPMGIWRWVGPKWVGVDKPSKRIDITGLFTSSDLRKLADWIDDPNDTPPPQLDPLC